MIISRIATVFLVAAFVFTSYSCEKHGDPVIRFNNGGITGKDTSVMVHDKVMVVLQAIWNGYDELDKLEVYQNGYVVQTFPLTGETANFSLNVTKGADEKEIWTFVVVDGSKNDARLDLVLTKDPRSRFGGITYFSSIVLGAQENSTRSGFLSLQTNQYFSLDQAFANQAKIDLIHYADPDTRSTLAGPKSDIPTGIFDIEKNLSKWNVRNETLFQKSTMTADEFDAIFNDAPILTAWNDMLAVGLADRLTLNEVWLLKMQSGRKGALLIKRVADGASGEVEFAIKMQK